MMGKLKDSRLVDDDVSPAFVVPGLTAAQREARQGKIGGSDAERIMAGDWQNLWLEKTKRQPPEDLSKNLAVQMGNVTQMFNAYWFELKTGLPVNVSANVTRRTHVHAGYDWMVANIDGLVIIDGRLRLFEGKHTNPFGSKGETPAKYYAQMQHCLEVLDLEGCEMSVFFGNADWQRFSVERDQDYCRLLLEREQEFWDYIVRDIRPDEGRNMAPAATVQMSLMRQLNMRGSNEWGDHEATWIRTREHIKQGDAAESALKAMMPVDCDFAFGNEVVCLRDRAGKLSLRFPNKKDSQRIDELLEAARQNETAADNFNL
jgi:hypothetical protein